MKKCAATIVKIVAHKEGRRFDEVAIHFVDKKTISQLHQDYFNDPTPTDCISFPLDSTEDPEAGYQHLGDIFVCPEAAILYSQSHSVDVKNELARYVIHGLLHLFGYDDIKLKDSKLMRKKEDEYLSLEKIQQAIGELVK